jgi:hypothetical protein
METTRHMGIYFILCQARSRVYIGQAYDTVQRIRDHYTALTSNRDHANPALQADWQQLGAGAFTGGVLELLVPYSQLNAFEAAYRQYAIALGLTPYGDAPVVPPARIPRPTAIGPGQPFAELAARRPLRARPARVAALRPFAERVVAACPVLRTILKPGGRLGPREWLSIDRQIASYIDELLAKATAPEEVLALARHLRLCQMDRADITDEQEREWRAISQATYDALRTPSVAER